MILEFEQGSYTSDTNYGDPFESPPELIVLHGSGLAIDATADNEIRYLRRPGIRVSYHFYVREDGRITQLVPLERRAFHAGESFYREHEREWLGLNAYSLGIGLESNNAEGERYPPEQVGATLGLTQLLMAQFGIPVWRVLTHRTVSPNRKVDPVSFPFDAFLTRLQEAHG